MNRRKFLGIAGGTILVTGAGFYLCSDKSNFVRSDLQPSRGSHLSIHPDEREILYLASLAPSGHNTQPWRVKVLAPYHWIISNDSGKWLPAVDPTHRETILSIGAFLQNLEYAASYYGYTCEWKLLAKKNEDMDITELRLTKNAFVKPYPLSPIRLRRTLRGKFQKDAIRKEDLDFLINDSRDWIQYFPGSTTEAKQLNEQTIEANRIQTYRDDAQKELSQWIRFSSKEAEKYADGLSTASMEMSGITAWVVRNFFNSKSVLKQSFREKTIDQVNGQVVNAGGWLIISSDNSSLADLLDCGKRMQRLFLRVRERGIAIHPMTQILEESSTAGNIPRLTGISSPVQFLLRTGYVQDYPEPVSLRRPLDRFVSMIS